jgi:hypothetical protein
MSFGANPSRVIGHEALAGEDDDLGSVVSIALDQTPDVSGDFDG